jgi:hypothetical protein
MQRTLTIAAAAATMLLSTSFSARGAPMTQRDAMRSAQYLVGTWNCAHTVGDFSGTYVTTFSTALEDRWLKQTYDFPATKTEPAVHAEYFFGYDPRVNRWVRFGAHSNGMYFGMKSTSIGEGTISYAYVLPGTSGNAVWTKKSDRQYTVDGPSYPQGGTVVTEHHVCRKAP